MKEVFDALKNTQFLLGLVSGQFTEQDIKKYLLGIDPSFEKDLQELNKAVNAMMEIADLVKDTMKAKAKLVWQLFCSLKDVGFTDEQAIHLTAAMADGISKHNPS